MVYNKNTISLLDEKNCIKDEMMNFGSREKFNQCNFDEEELNNLNENDNDDDDVRTGYLVRNLDILSVNDVYLGGEKSNNKDDIMFKLESMSGGRVRRSKNSNNLDHSVKSAAKITKNIFDATKTKLSMDIFETFNIGKYF